MSKMVEVVKEQRDVLKNKKVTNFMGGVSYELNPIDTLKMVTASSIFGEPQYYRDGEFAKKGMSDGSYTTHGLFKKYSVLPIKYEGLSTSEVMERVIDEALDYDFEKTIEWAVELRKAFNMRLNPQVIMVRASTHPKRVDFTSKTGGKFSEVLAMVLSRADEPASQLAYYLYRHNVKNNLPSILKRGWAKRLEKASRYELAKYKNSGLGIIDVVRISHANSPIIDELMQTGKVKTDSKDKTWEQLKSEGKNWTEILNQIELGHMALLRNLRGIFGEITSKELKDRVLKKLKDGVLTGKQFPFRYLSAYRAVKVEEVNFKPEILDVLEECIDISLNNLPKLKGKTMCLSDNSGSAWGSFTSEYGTVTVGEIGNLSSVITAMNSDEGYVGKFGDRLITFPISKRNGALIQTNEISSERDSDVGASTENGIWLFFKEAIEDKKHWDNIFIYSDQQAGHGGLYGSEHCAREYVQKGYSATGLGYSSRYLDVSKLIAEYRRTVNPKVNVFSIQTAGYENVVIPEYGYRTNILYGWTGRELEFASKMIEMWDRKDEEKVNSENS